MPLLHVMFAFLGDFIVYLINLTVISAISQNQYAIYKFLLWNSFFLYLLLVKWYASDKINLKYIILFPVITFLSMHAIIYSLLITTSRRHTPEGSLENRLFSKNEPDSVQGQIRCNKLWIQSCQS